MKNALTAEQAKRKMLRWLRVNKKKTIRVNGEAWIRPADIIEFIDWLKSTMLDIDPAYLEHLNKFREFSAGVVSQYKK